MRMRSVLFLICLLVISANCGSPFKNHFAKKLSFFKNQQTTPSPQSFNEATPSTQTFNEVYTWNIIDFLYPSHEQREDAIKSGSFIPSNNLPLGVDRYENRLFITTPRWNPGVPATLSWLPLPAVDKNLPLIPYPDWSYHTTPQNADCSKLVSVYRIYVDDCQRLWVLDAGVIDTLTNLTQVCPPKLMVFDLQTDRRIFTYVLPPSQVKQDSLHTNVIVDIRNGQCLDAYAYITDVWRYGVTVFSLAQFKSWRTTNYLYNPNPMASDYNYEGINFQWSDGVFGVSLTEFDDKNERLLLFHPMSSLTEFAVPTSVLRNETIWQNFGLAQAFKPIGSRGKKGQSSTSGISRNSVQFFTLVQQGAIGCWDIRKPYTLNNLGTIGKGEGQISFPNDLKLDKESEESVWVMSNNLPKFLYTTLNFEEVNFKILQLDINSAIKGSICDPQVISTIQDTPDLSCF